MKSSYGVSAHWHSRRFENCFSLNWGKIEESPLLRASTAYAGMNFDFVLLEFSISAEASRLSGDDCRDVSYP